jgi:hypothetical protein
MEAHEYKYSIGDEVSTHSLLPAAVVGPFTRQRAGSSLLETTAA